MVIWGKCPTVLTRQRSLNQSTLVVCWLGPLVRNARSEIKAEFVKAIIINIINIMMYPEEPSFIGLLVKLPSLETDPGINVLAE